jgi:hypothetical protein
MNIPSKLTRKTVTQSSPTKDDDDPGCPATTLACATYSRSRSVEGGDVVVVVAVVLVVVVSVVVMGSKITTLVDLFRRGGGGSHFVVAGSVAEDDDDDEEEEDVESLSSSLFLSNGTSNIWTVKG